MARLRLNEGVMWKDEEGLGPKGGAGMRAALWGAVAALWGASAL